MRTVRTTAGLAVERAQMNGSVGFVPTMGALHEGHLSLVKAARRDCDAVVVSIFVNPLQFGPAEDLDSYPRDGSADAALLADAEADLLFLPSVDEMYPPGRTTTVSVGPIGEVLEGADRPGHFDGVATVVAKLFNLVDPTIAYFGQKDAQQVAVIRQMVRDLSFDIELSICPTVRGSDGLALSSRNAYLSSDERARASAVYRAMVAGEQTLREEGFDAAEKKMWDLLVAERLKPSYASVVDPVTFGTPRADGPVLLVVAARLGSTRLIDNLLIEH